MAGDDSNGDSPRRRPANSPSSSDHINGNPPSTPDSPTSVGFNTDQLPYNTSQNYSEEDEASVDRDIIRDDPDDADVEEEEDGEDLFNDNYLEFVFVLL